jgi:hypothetical protein
MTIAKITPLPTYTSNAPAHIRMFMQRDGSSGLSQVLTLTFEDWTDDERNAFADVLNYAMHKAGWL